MTFFLFIENERNHFVKFLLANLSSNAKGTSKFTPFQQQNEQYTTIPKECDRT